MTNEATGTARQKSARTIQLEKITEQGAYVHEATGALILVPKESVPQGRSLGVPYISKNPRQTTFIQLSSEPISNSHPELPESRLAELRMVANDMGITPQF